MPSAVSSAPALRKYLALASPSSAVLTALKYQLASRTRRSFAVSVLLSHLSRLMVVVVVEPLVHLLAEVDLDVPAEAAVHGLHLVRLVRRDIGGAKKVVEKKGPATKRTVCGLSVDCAM